MRLIECGHNGEFTLTGDLIGKNIPLYAILSHRWGPNTEEVTFRDLADGTGTGKGKAGYKKLRFCAEQARRNGLRYFWVDTCCIDKSTSDEVQASINSMFRWYRDAARCYVYLSDVSITIDQSQLSWEPAFRASEWFTRGWTLQELIAPESVEFFTKEGQRLGDKKSLEQQIHEITGIALPALRGTSLSQFDVEERLKWAETRQTTREEDWAYCLLGIFGIFMPLIYGEGKVHAVGRLKKEIAEAMNRNDTPNHQGDYGPYRAAFQGAWPTRVTDLSWFYEAFQSVVRTANESSEACRDGDRNHDEDLLGYSNTTTFREWLRGGSLIWCRLTSNLNPAHDNIALCLAQQVVRELSCPVLLFVFSCSTAPRVRLPSTYVEARQKMYKGKSRELYDDPEKEELLKSPMSDLVETMLLSLLMQALHKGLKPNLRLLDLSSPQEFVSSMAEIFTTSIQRRSERVLVVVDHVDAIEEDDKVGKTDAIRRFAGITSSLFPQEERLRLSIIISAVQTPSISAALLGYPVVQSDSEYEECLKTLLLDERNIRKSEIAQAIGDTNSWIWTHPAFKKLMDEKSGALAIIGKAGSGKSVLAKTIQRYMISRTSSTDIIVADWFYCRRRGNVFVSYLSLLKSVLYEFLSHNLDGRRFFQQYKAPYRRFAPDPRREWTPDEMEGVLISLVGLGSPVVMIFDGIDEAKDDRMASFVQKLVGVPESSMKAIMLSRPLAAFDSGFWLSRQIVLQDWNGGDIQSVIADGLLRLRRTMWADDVNSNDSEWPTQEHAVLAGRTRKNAEDMDMYASYSAESETDMQRLERTLNENAKGVILWVLLVLDSFFRFVEAEGIVTLPELIEKVDAMPMETEDFYQQMVEDLSSRLSPSGLEKARTALMWINVGNEIKRLTFGELWDALAIPGDLVSCPNQLTKVCPIVSRRTEIRSWRDFRSILERLCGSFVEVFPAQQKHDGKLLKDRKWRTKPSSRQEVSESSMVQLIHQTAKDFLTSSAKAGRLGFTESEATSMLQSRCICYLRMVLPEPPLTFPPFDVICNDPANWRPYLARLAIYLEEYRLLELCCAVVNSQPNGLESLVYQVDLGLGGFIPPLTRRYYQGRGELALRQHVYDASSFKANAIVSSAFGHIFHFITAHGLLRSACNITSLLRLGQGEDTMTIYEDAILNAILFTMQDHDAIDELVGGTLAPGGWSPEGLVREFTPLLPNGTALTDELRPQYIRHKCNLNIDLGMPLSCDSVSEILHTSQEVLERLPGTQWTNRRIEVDKLLRILKLTWYGA